MDGWMEQRVTLTPDLSTQLVVILSIIIIPTPHWLSSFPK